MISNVTFCISLGAYKTHIFQMKLDLGPHDVMPETFEKYAFVEYNMPNSTVSRAQIRSISVETDRDDPPDRWVHHLAKYEYKTEIEFVDASKPPPVQPQSPGSPESPVPDSDHTPPEAIPDSDSSTSSDDD